MLGGLGKEIVQHDDSAPVKVDSPFEGLFDNTIAIARAESPDETPRAPAPQRRPPPEGGLKMPRYPSLNKSASVAATSKSTVSTDRNKTRPRETTFRVSSAPDVVVRPGKHRSSRSVSAWPPPPPDNGLGYKQSKPIGGSRAPKLRGGRSVSTAPMQAMTANDKRYVSVVETGTDAMRHETNFPDYLSS